MTTDKKNIQVLAEVCRIKGLKHVVFSPGSRSAPLVIAFSQMKEIKCHVIPDERVAGFFALGIAQQLRQTVAVVCTSGTAVLNLSPAICEAYYQQVPLLILTADRPPEHIGIGENQAIDQTEIYRNYIKASYTLPENVADAANMTAQVIAETKQHYRGPVHINIPLREPLYGMSSEPLPDYSITTLPVPPLAKPSPATLTTRNMLICGMHEPDAKLQEALNKLSLRDDFVIVTEPIANMHVAGAVTNIDTVMAMMSEAEYATYRPDTVITIGRQIVSKRLRQYLRKVAPARHYHISTDSGLWNGLGAKEYNHIAVNETAAITALNSSKAPLSDYGRSWKLLDQKALQCKKEIAAMVPFSDWWVFADLVATYPEGANIQYGNSSPIRYACLWAHRSDLTVNSNRGTSGIDGCVSTAAGAALASGRMTIAIVGDVSFIYDSNSLWNSSLPGNLRIIVINNGGGNIFSLIDGPQQVQGFEKFFQTKHELSAEYLARMYEIPYYFCDRGEDMNFVLEQFYKPQKGNKPAIMEIKTDSEVNARVFKDYFQHLKIK